jgi:hypothetical protein
MRECLGCEGSGPWVPQYESWRHGGWYVTNLRRVSGAVGCVSRNYPDRKWRIVCDDRPNAHSFTYASRDAAAYAERHLYGEPCPACLGTGRQSDVIPARDAIADAAQYEAAVRTGTEGVILSSGAIQRLMRSGWQHKAAARARVDARAAFTAVPALRGEK